jgi:uncharacterized membrane protein YkoI
MKKILSMIFILPAFCAVSAQKTGVEKIPAATMEAFMQKFPGVAGKWEKEYDNYEVNFRKDGKSMSAVIDGKGTILETETDIAVTLLPAGVKSYIKAHYKKAAIKEAAQIVKANGEIIYEVDVNKNDVLFDADGRLIKGKK